MRCIVEADGLTKRFGRVTAVDGISLGIEEGMICGLLGRNGAGKTTLMQMITAQLFPTGGELRVFGQRPYENRDVLSRVCFVKEGQRYPDSFRVRDVMALAPSFLSSWDADFAAALVAEFRLPPDRHVKRLSRGMLSSVGIVLGLASRASLTIFDEPYLGLDAVSRGIFYDRLLEDYAEHPRTVILSTHLIDEVSNLLEHVIVLDSGQIVLDESAEDLRGRAYAVAGQASKVSRFSYGRRVIHREQFGGLASMTVMGQLTDADRRDAAELELELSPVSLQQLIAHMTGGNAAGKVVQAS